jgi:ankyrin repeat protein
MPALPERPSREHLRKAAKRLARERSLPLATAQFSLAQSYGFRTWAELMRHIERVRASDSPARSLFAAVRASDIGAVTRLLADGANPRLTDGRETPLHAAARHGPLALVEALIAGGALEWQTDSAGRIPLEVARRGRASERAAIIALLDRGSIADPAFRAAVAAVHAGDTTALERSLDAEPRLLHDPIVGPDVYRNAPRRGYFVDPKLVWYLANNPRLVERIAPNIEDIARIMLARGVDQSDLDYTLELTMTSASAREGGKQLPLMRLLLQAGAVPTRKVILATAAHGELDALRALVDVGVSLDVRMAAALGVLDALRELIATADRDDVAEALALAVINGHCDAVRIALAAGADVNAYLPVHSHSTPLHQAALGENVELIEILLAAGARTDTRDTLWSGTPLDWAIHEGRSVAQNALANAAQRG